jgi:hypothetical protein
LIIKNKFSILQFIAWKNPLPLQQEAEVPGAIFSTCAFVLLKGWVILFVSSFGLFCGELFPGHSPYSELLHTVNLQKRELGRVGVCAYGGGAHGPSWGISLAPKAVLDCIPDFSEDANRIIMKKPSPANFLEQLFVFL